MENKQDYSRWSTEELIKRVTSLEQQLKQQTASANPASSAHERQSPPRKPKNVRVNREIDRSKYSTRFIALKIAYLGQHYNGLEFHPRNETPLPTIEEELWKALNKAKLVFPTNNPLLNPHEPNWEGCDFSKSGRTDKGVSAFGQVIGIRVRSNQPVQHGQILSSEEKSLADSDGQASGSDDGHDTSAMIEQPEKPDECNGHSSKDDFGSQDSHTFNHINDEIAYCQILNRLLPPDIRVLAWCPKPPANFSARFSCRERRYKYFFTQPAFTPTPGLAGLHGTSNDFSTEGRSREGWLNIEAMRTAAHKLIGLHDFRNFCKVDPSKQIENFERRITHAEIERFDHRQHPLGYVSQQGFSQYPSPSPSTINPDDPLSDRNPQTPIIHTLTLHGSAFLWHQVRHIASILFLIGQNLEPPSLIDTLLDVKQTPCKPQYEMADDAPLVLWDCIFPDEKSGNMEDAMEWIYVGNKGAGMLKTGGGAGRHGVGGLIDEIWRVWRSRKMDEILAGGLLDVIVSQGHPPAAADDASIQDPKRRSQRVFLGGDGAKLVGKYVPIMQKPRIESVEVINAKYAKRKGFEQKEGVREQGFRRLSGMGDEDAGG